VIDPGLQNISHFSPIYQLSRAVGPLHRVSIVGSLTPSEVPANILLRLALLAYLLVRRPQGMINKINRITYSVSTLRSYGPPPGPPPIPPAPYSGVPAPYPGYGPPRMYPLHD